MVEKLHPALLTTAVPSRDLGRELVALRYDLLEEVVIGMRDEAARQVQADRARGRPMLAHRLARVHAALSGLSDEMASLRGLCGPHIADEKRALIQGRSEPGT